MRHDGGKYSADTMVTLSKYSYGTSEFFVEMINLGLLSKHGNNL